MEGNRINLIRYARDIISGKGRGKYGEHGWARDSWQVGNTVCLNGALFVAERDLLNMGGKHGVLEEGPPRGELFTPRMYSDEGADAQQLLADTIMEMHPGLKPSGSDAQDIIISFNDGGPTMTEMEAVLGKCEEKAWDKWLNDRPGGPTHPDADLLGIV